MEDNGSIPDVFAPDAKVCLMTAKTSLIRAVEALLTQGRYNQARNLIGALETVDYSLNDKAVQAGPISNEDKRFAANEVDAMKAGRKIDAIKLVRERTGMGLKEAKDLVESYTGR